jgi:chondroitin sulfate synthase
VFVGVMTSKDFLESRAKAVYNTWGKLVPGRIAFFSSEGSSSDGKHLKSPSIIVLRAINIT